MNTLDVFSVPFFDDDMKTTSTQFRPGGAQDLAQGKRYSAPPWVARHTNHLAALKGQDKISVNSLALTGRLFSGHTVTQGVALG